MLVFREHIGASELIIWRMDETLEEMMELTEHHYDHELAEISNPTRKKERITSRFLLETLVGRKVEIKYEESGKPICSGINFSISHTKNYVAVIVGKEPVGENSVSVEGNLVSVGENFAQVGVDIEYKNDRIFRVTEKFMHPEELKILSECTEKQKFALLCWCAKETAYKILDENGVDFAEMNCKIDSENIFLSYKNAHFTLKFLDFTDFFIVFS
jgi:phosphopantetheinyl transferase